MLIKEQGEYVDTSGSILTPWNAHLLLASLLAVVLCPSSQKDTICLPRRTLGQSKAKMEGAEEQDRENGQCQMVHPLIALKDFQQLNVASPDIPSPAVNKHGSAACSLIIPLQESG